MTANTRSYFCATALLSAGWAQNISIKVSSRGDILRIESGQVAGAQPLPGIVIPGMPNLHSHAFQRALAGLAEYLSNPSDSFWTWRNLMYDFVASISPEELEIIATQLYLEMLKAGYTSVAEFHYLHHDRDGHPYADASRMSQAILAAAQSTGLGLTHLPVLYMTAGFGAKPPLPKQRRFIHSPASFIALLEQLQPQLHENPQLSLGMALHSLRAVPPEPMQEVLTAYRRLQPAGPVHIHIAEQLQEVEDCLAVTGQRPVEWLLEHQAVDRHWCLVHATHMSDKEVSALAAAGAVAGICPTTEANLGDGLFPLKTFIAQGGRLGIGSDSNSSVSPIEELRWLEYGQRLLLRQRNIACDVEQAHVGRFLWQQAAEGGAQALGRKAGRIEVGYRADLLVLNPEHPSLVGRQADQYLDSLLFSGNSNAVTDVIAGGHWVVRDGKHAREDEITAAYRALIKRRGAQT